MQIDGDLHTTIKFVDSLKIPYIAASFGGCESIVDQPAILSYWYSFFRFFVYVVIIN
jgi:cystathionine gamma-synthase